MDNGVVCLRWFSMMNDWMDCIIFVPEWAQEAATQAIRAGIDFFWDNHCFCYGDCIVDALNERGVPYAIEYIDEHAYTEEQWEQHVSSFASIGVPVHIVLT